MLLSASASLSLPVSVSLAVSVNFPFADDDLEPGKRTKRMCSARAQDGPQEMERN